MDRLMLYATLCLKVFDVLITVFVAVMAICYELGWQQPKHLLVWSAFTFAVLYWVLWFMKRRWLGQQVSKERVQ